MYIVNFAPRLDWFILIAHTSKDGRLIITSPSHLKSDSRTWLQIGVHNQKWGFQKVHDNEKYDQIIT
jgi:hypothetical protein